MISNKDVTIYHKSIDVATRLEQWTRYNYTSVWYFGRQTASVNKGYDNANSVEVRIPMSKVASIDNFAIGDIIVLGNLSIDISTQQDLNGYIVHNITAIANNDFGGTPHVHISGK